MPAGRYRVMDGDGNALGTESFRCGPGPAGWRYVSDIEISEPEPHAEVVDVAVDSAWRPVRLRIETGAHHLMVSPQGRRLTGVRDGELFEYPWGPEIEVDYFSPSFNGITANRLGCTAEIEVVFLAPFTCEPRWERQRYELEGEEEVETPVGRFVANRWQYTALRTGWSRPLWVAGDLVVAYEGLFELEEYEPGASGVAPVQQ